MGGGVTSKNDAMIVLGVTYGVTPNSGKTMYFGMSYFVHIPLS